MLLMTHSTPSESALRCMGGQLLRRQRLMYSISLLVEVFPHTQAGQRTRSNAQSSRTCCSFVAESMCTSDCARSIVSRCVLSLVSTSFSLSSLLPSLFAFISHRPPPRSELSSTPSSLPHPVCHQLWAQRIHSHMSAAFMTRTEIVLLVWITQKKLTLHLKTADNTWAACGLLFVLRG